jgi:hypothetical protein
MTFPTEWNNKKCSKPPTRNVVVGIPSGKHAKNY